MLKYGFALTEIRQMYIDEYQEYYNELIYNLEQAGEVKQGTYNRLAGIDNTQQELDKLLNIFKK